MESNLTIIANKLWRVCIINKIALSNSYCALVLHTLLPELLDREFPGENDSPTQKSHLSHGSTHPNSKIEWQTNVDNVIIIQFTHESICNRYHHKSNI